MRARLLVALLVAAALAACQSPEAQRTRGHGPGADVGNRRPAVIMHEGAHPFFRTPCRTMDVSCTGPLPDFGTGRRATRQRS